MYTKGDKADVKSFVLNKFYLSDFLFFYLGKSGSSSLRLNGNGLCPALQDLVNVLLTEFGPFILLIHDCPVGPTSQQIFNRLFGQLLLHSL